MNAPHSPASVAEADRYTRLPLDAIAPSRTNPRKHFDAAKLEELAASIRLHGVMEPVLVRPEFTVRVHCAGLGLLWYPEIQNIAGAWNVQGTGHRTEQGAEAEAEKLRNRYELVFGERRLRAAKLAKLDAIPALVRRLTDLQVLEMQVVENLQRDDLHPIEEADGYDRLIKEHGYTADALAEKIGKSRSYVYGRLKLAALTPKSRDLFYEGKLDASTALLVARIPAADQDKAAKDVTTHEMSYRHAVDFVHREYMVELKGAAFKLDDAGLLPKAGACKTCPKRSGNAKDLFTDVPNPNICTDPGCYKAKEEAWIARRRAELETEGETVISGARAKKIKPDRYSRRLTDGYVDLSDEDQIGDKWQTWRKAIGKQPCPVALLECPHTGKFIEIAKRDDVGAALKANGIDLNASRASAKLSHYGTRQADEERKARLETSIRLAVMAQIRNASRVRAFDRDDTVLVASAFFERLHFDTGKRLVDAWNAGAGVKKPKGNAYVRDFAKTIPAMSDGELGALFIDMALIGDCHVAVYYKPDDKDLVATAKRLGIDAAKVRAEMTAAAKAKAAVKKATKPTKGKK